MSVTITIPPELEAKIAQRAALKGMPLEEYARAVLEQDATMLTMRELFAPVRQQVAESGVSEQELDELLETARERAHQERQTQVE